MNMTPTPTPTATPTATPTPTAMTFTDSVHSAEVFLADDAWVMEPKYDGVRCLVHVDDGRVRLENRNGKLLSAASTNSHRPGITAAFESMNLLGSWTFDGELLEDGRMIVFDLPRSMTAAGRLVGPETPFERRREVLEKLGELTGWGSSISRLRVATQVTSESDKRVMFETIRETGGEGVMFKRADARYECKRTRTAGFKMKFTSTADVVVKAPGAGDKASCTIVVFDDRGDEIVVGHCSTHQKPIVREGDVIEVRYLYVGTNGHLVQPRMLRVRDDKYQSQCGIDQLASSGVKKWVA